MNEKRITEEIVITNAKLIFKNLEGRENKVNGRILNNKGERSFGVFIDPAMAERLSADGWKIKFLPPRPDDPDQSPKPWMRVKVKYGKIPPIVNLISSRGKTRLTEETVGIVDTAWCKNVDLVIRPYNYPESNFGPAGVAAYLKAMYVTIHEDEFADKYKDIPDADDWR